VNVDEFVNEAFASLDMGVTKTQSSSWQLRAEIPAPARCWWK
jgi:hypothetical protein